MIMTSTSETVNERLHKLIKKRTREGGVKQCHFVSAIWLRDSTQLAIRRVDAEQLTLSRGDECIDNDLQIVVCSVPVELESCPTTKESPELR